MKADQEFYLYLFCSINYPEVFLKDRHWEKFHEAYSTPDVLDDVRNKLTNSFVILLLDIFIHVNTEADFQKPDVHVSLNNVLNENKVDKNIIAKGIQFCYNLNRFLKKNKPLLQNPHALNFNMSNEEFITDETFIDRQLQDGMFRGRNNKFIPDIDIYHLAVQTFTEAEDDGDTYVLVYD